MHLRIGTTRVCFLLLLFGMIGAGPAVGAKIELWATDAANDEIVIIAGTLNSKKLTLKKKFNVISTGGAPAGLAYHPGIADQTAARGARAGGFVVVANSLDDSVSWYDAKTRRVLATTQVGTRPGPVAISPDGRFSFVGNGRSKFISVLDNQSFEELGRRKVGKRPIALSVAPNGSFLVAVIKKAFKVLALGRLTGSSNRIGAGAAVLRKIKVGKPTHDAFIQEETDSGLSVVLGGTERGLETHFEALPSFPVTEVGGEVVAVGGREVCAVTEDDCDFSYVVEVSEAADSEPPGSKTWFLNLNGQANAHEFKAAKAGRVSGARRVLAAAQAGDGIELQTYLLGNVLEFRKLSGGQRDAVDGGFVLSWTLMPANNPPKSGVIQLSSDLEERSLQALAIVE